MNELNEYVKILRKKLKLTQVQLSEQTGISTSQISKIENGKQQTITLETAAALAEVLGEHIFTFAPNLEKKLKDQKTKHKYDTYRKDAIINGTKTLIRYNQKKGWDVLKPYENCKQCGSSKYAPDILMKNKDDKLWIIEFYSELIPANACTSSNDYYKENKIQIMLAKKIAKLVIHAPNNLTKFSIAVFDKSILEVLCSMPLNLLKLEYSLFLVTHNSVTEIFLNEKLNLQLPSYKITPKDIPTDFKDISTDFINEKKPIY